MRQVDKETDAVTSANDRLTALASDAKAKRSSGSAFVTFEEAAEGTRVAAMRYLNYRAASGKVVRLAVTRAPEPTDITWENLPCSALECGLRQGVGTLLMLLIAFSGTLLITVAQYLTPTLQAPQQSLTCGHGHVRACAVTCGYLFGCRRRRTRSWPC